jgi:hypothetical protein
MSPMPDPKKKPFFAKDGECSPKYGLLGLSQDGTCQSRNVTDFFHARRLFMLGN